MNERQASVTKISTDLPSNEFADESDSQLITQMQTSQSQPISTQKSNQAGRENKKMECKLGASYTNSPIASTYISPYAIIPPTKASQDLVKSQKHDVDLLLF